MAANPVKAVMTGGNTVGAALRELEPRADGYRHIDTPALIARLQETGVNTYVYGVWDSPTDWDDLRLEFVPAAAQAGIEVWPYIVPPTECSDAGRCSRPYRTDYIAWSREIGMLSAQYPNLTAWGIDDFHIGQNQDLFTPDYVRRMHETYKSHNPNLRFWLCAYYDAALDDAFLDKYRAYIDGLLFPYLDGWFNNLENSASLPAVLDNIRQHTEPRGLELVLLAYCGRFLDAVREPDDAYVDSVVRTGLRYANEGKLAGVLCYGMPVDDAPLPASENRAMYGVGRLSITVAHHVPTPQGASAWAEQRVAVDPDAPRHELSFWHRDDYSSIPALMGYHIKQVLIDGRIVWESDVTDTPPERWINGHPWQGPIDVTGLLRGRTEATLTFRLYERNGVHDFGIDTCFDNIETIGFTVANPGFETRDGWTFGHDHGGMNAGIDLAPPDRPQRIRQAIASAFRG